MVKKVILSHRVCVKGGGEAKKVKFRYLKKSFKNSWTLIRDLTSLLKHNPFLKNRALMEF